MSIQPMAQDWLERHLIDQLAAKRTPFSGTFELTWACNFHCRHCYLRGAPPAGPEMDTERILALLDELARAGCLSLTLTGGEPLMRPDFLRLLAGAGQRGFLVNLFTNASLVTPGLARALAGHPPRKIEVSLYGASRAGYERVTGRGEHFDAALAGIDLLLDNGLDLWLKVPLLAPLLGEIDALRELARRRGLRLRFDPGLDPTLGGEPEPLDLRVAVERAAAVELDDPVLRELAAGALGRGLAPASACGAARRSFHLDPFGRLMPCLLVREPALEVEPGGLAAAWQRLEAAAPVGYGPEAACRDCRWLPVCSSCAGREALLRRAGRDPDYHCRLAAARGCLLASQRAG